MDNYSSTPRNQQLKDENEEENSSSANQEFNISSFQRLSPVQELNMSTPQTYQGPSPLHTSDSTNNSCSNDCRQLLTQHSRQCTNIHTPQRNNLTFVDTSDELAEQRGPSVADLKDRPVDWSRANSAADLSCRNEFSQRTLYDAYQEKREHTASTPLKVKKEKKEKKTITSKTFAHGLMDMSLMTSNASQLRSVMSNPDHEFYRLLIWLLILSVILQILSGIVLIWSDFYKSQIKEKDRQNQKKRKVMNFVALAMMMVITSLNILITAFNTPGGTFRQTTVTVPKTPQQPVFSSADYQLHLNHTEL